MNRRESIIAIVALGAAAGPIASLAQQQGKVWRVGFLSLSSASESVQNTAAFLKALRELGYIESKNLVVEWRFAEGSFERLTGQAADLVRLRVDVIAPVRHRRRRIGCCSVLAVAAPRWAQAPATSMRRVAVLAPSTHARREFQSN